VVLTSDNVAIWAPGFDPGQWKLLTHWLVAPGLLAAVLDVLCVYFAGRMVEELFGTRRFTLLFIAACVLAGLLAGLVDPLLMGQSRSVIMGPAAGAFAAFTTLAWIAPGQRSMLGFRMRPMVLTIVGIVCGPCIPWPHRARVPDRRIAGADPGDSALDGRLWWHRDRTGASRCR
jgi:membrane associated rhomboid family serine protease